MSYFVNHPRSALERVYFLNFKEDELKVCQRILQQSPHLVPDAIMPKAAVSARRSKRQGAGSRGKKGSPKRR